MQSTPYDGRPETLYEMEEVETVDAVHDTDDIEDPDARAEIEWKKAEIEQTRTEVGETLAAIREKLDPHALIDQAKEKVQDMTSDAVDRARHAAVGRARDAMGNVVESARDTGSAVVDRVRENPIPMAMIGIGVAWLIADALRSRRAGRRSSDYYSTYDRDDYNRSSGGASSGSGCEQDYGSGYAGTSTFAGESDTGLRDRISDRVDDVRDNLTEAAGALRRRAAEMAGEVRERAGDMADRVQGRVTDVSGRVRERAGTVAGEAGVRAGLARLEGRDLLDDMNNCIHDTMQSSPMAFTLVAVGVGAAVGFLLPETRREHEWLGDYRDRLADRTRDVVEDVRDRAQVVAEKVKGVAAEALDQAKHTAQETLQQVKQTAVDEARNQGLAPEGLTGKQAA